MGFDSDLAKSVEENFSQFDGDGNNQVSRFELEKAESNERLSDEARETARTLSKNFDAARGMAGPSQSDLFSGTTGKYLYDRLFVEGDVNAITKRDVAVMKMAAQSPEAIDAVASDIQLRERRNGVGEFAGGAAMLVPGLVLDAAGIALFETPAVLLTVPGFVLTMGGGAMVYQGYRELTQNTGDAVRTTLHARQDTIKSWEVTKPVP